MKSYSSLATLLAAALLATPVAYAETVAGEVPQQVATRVVFQGTDAQGRVVQLTIADIDVPELVRISTNPSHVPPPQPHWTSKIGTGQAASLEP